MTKFMLVVLMMGTALMACATVTVNVSTPANNANVSATVQVAATASTTVSSISGWRIYVDDVSVYIGSATSAINPNIKPYAWNS